MPRQTETSKPRPRGDSAASTTSNGAKPASEGFEELNSPEGFVAATAEGKSNLNGTKADSSQPSTHVVHEETFRPAPNKDSWTTSDEDTAGRGLDGISDTGTRTRSGNEAAHQVTAKSSQTTENQGQPLASSDDATLSGFGGTPEGSDADLYQPFDNGYHFPPKYSAKVSFKHGMIAFWKYFTTPLGFCVVIYALNVVAWGGMLFLLLCNASPAMCFPSCKDIDSPLKKWIEWDSQILNALFCVTGFGLAPWRFRDMYYLLKFRILGNRIGLRRLAGIHRSWFRLEGSQNLPVDVGPDNIPDNIPRDVIPYPIDKISDAPLTGTRAPPTQMWKLDFILWMNIGNTFLQCCLSGLMWGMDRYTRPGWATGLFVGLACIVGAIGGLGMFFEGKTVKSIEGVPVTNEDKEKLVRDKEQGIYHYNNLKAKKPKEKGGDPEANTEKGSKRRRIGLGRKQKE